MTRPSVGMEIRLLADVPAAIPTLAEWFHSEWHHYDGRSVAEVEVELRHYLNRDSLPITFLALNGTEVIGTVSLDTSNLPPYDHLSPWLASLYVVPSAAAKGSAAHWSNTSSPLHLSEAFRRSTCGLPVRLACTRSAAGNSSAATSIPGDPSRSCSWRWNRS